jgi:hypothetical protein
MQGAPGASAEERARFVEELEEHILNGADAVRTVEAAIMATRKR